MNDPTQQTTNSDMLNVNEGIVFDLLAELDKERQKRANLEEQIRRRSSTAESAASTELAEMLADLHGDGGFTNTNAALIDPPAPASSPNSPNSTAHIIAELQATISSLTTSNTALQINKTQHDSNIPALPSHTILSLESFPERVDNNKSLSSIKLTAFEWQKDNNNLPDKVNSLPLRRPSLLNSIGINKTDFFFTDVDLTFRCANLDDMFVLEELNLGGDWAWGGGWQIDKSNSDKNGFATVVVDDDKSLQPSPAPDNKKTLPIFSWRRRTWARQLLLVSYQGISERAKYFLNSQMSIVSGEMLTSKLSDQLLELQMSLLDRDEHIAVLRHESTRYGDLMTKLERATEKIGNLQLENRNLKSDAIFAAGVITDEDTLKKTKKDRRRSSGADELKDKIEETVGGWFKRRTSSGGSVEQQEPPKVKSSFGRRGSLDAELVPERQSEEEVLFASC